MPFKRHSRGNLDPLPLEEELFMDDDDLNAFLDNEVTNFSQQAIDDFYLSNFKDKDVVTSDEFSIETVDDMVLYILGIVHAQFDEMFFKMEKLEDEITNGKFKMPLYRFTRKKKGGK